MSSTKTNRTSAALEYGPQPDPRPELRLECVRVREERQFPSFLLVGTGGFPQCARGEDQGFGGEASSFGHARGETRH